ncbi:MAG: hypothetical protein JW909_04955 [Planctomycetes bacterium]|nr:hypothetical protein [Planctomycetota bacterium]
MSEYDPITASQCGARVENGALFSGGDEVVFTSRGARSLGAGGYSVKRSRGKARVAARPGSARYAALLELQSMQASQAVSVTRRPRFSIRNYKHELNLIPDTPRSILSYTEDFWSSVCREIVRRHFTGVVFYINAVPFEHFLDFNEFSDATDVPADVRSRVRDAFNMLLAVSRRYGLRTFLQEYLSHYPARLADSRNLLFNARNRSGAACLANFHHPVLHDFFRYTHTRIFELCPDLDGLYLNYESSPNAVELMKDVVIPALSSLERPPVLFHRLWYFTVPREMCDMAESYPGETVVGHKIMDTMDAYNYPAADTRIAEWKAAFAERGLDIPFVYLVGPCHNCGSNISRRLWSDPEFIHAALSRALKLGADGISFHTVWELTADEFDSSPVIDPHEREMARLNHFHLESVVDFVRGLPFDEKRVVSEHARHFRLKSRGAASLYRTLRDSSRAEILHLMQFPLTTQEGYHLDARRQLSQHPFFYMPVSYHNRQHAEDPHQFWSYLSKAKKASPYPGDLQTIFDFVDPAAPVTKNNPLVLAASMERLGKSSAASARTLARKVGPELALLAADNRHVAVSCARDIRAGAALFRLYFDASRSRAVAHVEEAIAELSALKRDIRTHGVPYIHMHGGHDPDRDISALKKLKRALRTDFPFPAFRSYAESRRLYCEIRRHVRPWRMWSARSIRKASSLLKRSRSAALAALDKCRDTRFASNVRLWIDWLDSEISWIKPMRLTCSDLPGELIRMVHDNCFGYGGFAWQDFLSFFQPLRCDKDVRLFCGVHREADRLVISAHEDGCDMKERTAHWARFAGGRDPAGFLRVFIDTANDGRRLQCYSIFPGAAAATRFEMQVRGRQDVLVLPDRVAAGWDATFAHDRDSWTLVFKIPFKQLGGAPAKGDTWGFNVTGNTHIARNHGVALYKAYEMGPGNPSRMCTLEFV